MAYWGRGKGCVEGWRGGGGGGSSAKSDPQNTEEAVDHRQVSVS